jgi:hypothetical protein
VPALSCGVSLLSGFEPAAGPYDWQVRVFVRLWQHLCCVVLV